MKMVRGPMIVAHGDMDGIASAALQAGLLNIPADDLMVLFCQPFTVDKIKIPDDVEQVYVVDIAVNNRDPQMTEQFIEYLGDKLAVWTDHHQGWPEKYKNVRNYHFYIKEVEACANLFAGKSHFAVSDAIVADAVAADTRKGELSPRGQLIEQATKANMQDDSIRVAAVKWLLGDEPQKAVLERAAEKYAEIQKETNRFAVGYEVSGRVAIVDARNSNHEYDLTQLLLKGQKLAEFAVVKVIDSRSKEERITIATLSGKDLVKLFELPSGSPSRVSLEAARLPEVLEKLNADSNGRLCNCGQAKVMEPHERTPFCG